jgi:hypothetical protein
VSFGTGELPFRTVLKGSGLACSALGGFQDGAGIWAGCFQTSLISTNAYCLMAGSPVLSCSRGRDCQGKYAVARGFGMPSRLCVTKMHVRRYFCAHRPGLRPGGWGLPRLPERGKAVPARSRKLRLALALVTAEPRERVFAGPFSALEASWHVFCNYQFCSGRFLSGPSFTGAARLAGIARIRRDRSSSVRTCQEPLRFSVSVRFRGSARAARILGPSRAREDPGLQPGP